MILMTDKIKEHVKKRYGKIAVKEQCGCGPSCCGSTNYSERIGYSKGELQRVPAGADLGLGCGNPTALASLKKGEIVLDLGSGAGLDAFLAAKKVGPSGRVIGVDMTPEMVEKARANSEGYSNVEFRLGEIEHLPLPDSSVDVIISNCVINLSPDKQQAYSEAYRVLRPGGRMLISDIVLKGELPAAVRKDPDSWSACIAGALQKEEYLEIIRKAGFSEIRLLSEKVMSWEELNEDIEGMVIILAVEARKPTHR